jgi:hypothetical protein
MSSLVERAYKSLLRTQKFVTFRNDPLSFQKAVEWNREFIKKNITNPQLPNLLLELESFLRRNVVQVEKINSGRFHLKIHSDIEFSDKNSKFQFPMKSCQ